MQLVYESPASIKRPVPKLITDRAEAVNAAARQQQMAAQQRQLSGNYASSSPSSISSSSMSSMSSPNQGKGGMWGYGNPNYVEAPPSVLDKMRDKVSETITSLGESKPSLPANYKGAHNFSSSSSSSGGGAAAGYQGRSGISESYQAARNATLTFDDAPERRRGEIGGGWGEAQSPSAAPRRVAYEARTTSTPGEPRSPVVSQAPAAVTEPAASDLLGFLPFLKPDISPPDPLRNNFLLHFHDTQLSGEIAGGPGDAAGRNQGHPIKSGAL